MPYRPTAPRTAHSGFTLLELLVVLVIMSVVMAVVAPRLGGQFGEDSLRAAAAELSSLASVARYRAAQTGTPMTLRLNRRTTSATLHDTGPTPVRTARLPQKVRMDTIRREGRMVTAEQVDLTFTPQGTATQATLRLSYPGVAQGLVLQVAAADGGIHAR